MLTELILFISTLCRKFEDVRNNLLDYLASSSTPGFNHKKVYSDLLNRVEHSTPGWGYAPHESPVFNKRFKVLQTKNEVYLLATKDNPTVADLERFSVIEPCFSLLWPLKLFLLDHPEQARVFKGCVPFGRPVITFYNAHRPDKIKGTPTFTDHILLREWTNQLAATMGMSSVAINTWMYLEGRKLMDGAGDDSSEGILIEHS